jgi:hypothetical protein
MASFGHGTRIDRMGLSHDTLCSALFFASKETPANLIASIGFHRYSPDYLTKDHGLINVTRTSRSNLLRLKMVPHQYSYNKKT